MATTPTTALPFLSPPNAAPFAYTKSPPPVPQHLTPAASTPFSPVTPAIPETPSRSSFSCSFPCLPASRKCDHVPQAVQKSDQSPAFESQTATQFGSTCPDLPPAAIPNRK